MSGAGEGRDGFFNTRAQYVVTGGVAESFSCHIPKVILCGLKPELLKVLNVPDRNRFRLHALVRMQNCKVS